MHVETLTVQSFLRWFEKNLGFEIYLKLFADGSGMVSKKDDNKEILSFKSSLDLYQKIKQITEKFPLEHSR